MARIEKFWHDLLPHEPSNITIQNKSSDVFVKDCFGNFDTTACVRNSFLTFLGFMSFFFCIIRIAKLHVLHHPQIHQYLIFYLATLEVIFLIVKWIALMSLYQLEFVASFLKMVQFILLCHFHWSLVSRILHQQKIINWVIMPLLAAFLSFFALITAFGLLTHFSTWDYCLASLPYLITSVYILFKVHTKWSLTLSFFKKIILAPHWVLLSFAEFLGIQLYVIAGIYITKKINSVSALDSFKWEQKRDLWSVIVVYEFSSVVSLSYYSTLQGLGTFETGCSGIFDNAQNIYSPVYVAIMMIKYLGPIWIMLLVFYPTRGCLSSEDQRLLGLSCDGSTTSTFNPGSRFQDSYKQLILPVQNDLNFVSQEYPPLRRSASSPAFFSKSPLSPIYEDMILPPARVPVPNYGAMDSCSSQPEYVVFKQSRTRSRHDSGIPSKNPKGKALKIVSLNQCSDEMESITPSPSERV